MANRKRVVAYHGGRGGRVVRRGTATRFLRAVCVIVAGIVHLSAQTTSWRPTVVAQHGGRIPSDPTALQRLPGIGPYTAAAVASLAHGRAVPMVETNIRRVLGRMERVSGGDVSAMAERWLDRDRPADWNQALMDLGRDVCRPGRPRCDACPVRSICRSAGRAARSPARSPQSTFEGSFRQVRGRVVADLSAGGSRSISSLSRAIDAPPDILIRAVRALARDGIVSAGDAAMAGAPAGRVSLAR